MTKNYYEILGIALTNDEQTIKDAYTLKLRQHAKDASQFQLIQEAYTVLTDAKKKYVHDIEVMYGPTITALRQQAQNAREQQNYAEAEQAYQQLLQYFPEDDILHNYHGIVLDALGQYDRAIRAFERAIALNENAGVYYVNLGEVYECQEQTKQAIRCYKQAIVAEPHRSEHVHKLANVYMHMEEYDHAWQLIEKGVTKPSVHMQEKVLYTKKLLEIAIVSDDDFSMKIALKYMEKFAAVSEDDRDNIVKVIGNFCLELGRRELYKPAYTIVATLKKMDPYDAEIEALYDAVKQHMHIAEETNALLEDEHLFRPLRLRIYLYYYHEHIDDAQAKTDDMNDAIWEAIEYEPHMLKRSIEHLRRHYPTVAEGMSEWLAIVEGEL